MKRLFQGAGKVWIIILMIALLLTGCALLPSTVANVAREAANGVTAEDSVVISREEFERFQRYAEIDELLRMVELYYYQEPDIAAMLERAAQGLLYGLEDPYTFYYTPEQFKDMWEADKGEYAGIGIQLQGSYETFLCTITRVFEGTPAFEAGLHKGDILVKVDDLDVTAYTINEAVAIMRGEVGGIVEMQVIRGEETLDFSVPRAVVHVNWVSSCMLDESVGYIVLYEFSGDCSEKFREQMEELQKQGAKGLVVDLRDNGGGWVEDALNLADIFLPEGTITYLEDRYGGRQYYKATAGALDMPLVVLVNENSASASEILAGALQDYEKATIVGVKSFGKGVVQNVLDVSTSGAGAQITAAQYYTPNGNAVHKVGITPDVEALLPEGDNTLYELGDMADAQLKKAYEVALELLQGK